jgi:hypothetical protein
MFISLLSMKCMIFYKPFTLSGFELKSSVPEAGAIMVHIYALTHTNNETQ